MNFLNFLLPKIKHFKIFGYWIFLLLVLSDSLAFIGVLIPGSLVVTLAGFLATRGVLDPGDLVWFMAVGAICGDTISFYLGRNGKKIFHEDNKIFKSSHLKKSEDFFEAHGGKSLFLGRFIGPIRPVIPFVIGLSGMKAKRFFCWDIISAFSWTLTYMLLGFFFGQAWQSVGAWSTRAGFFLLILFLFFLIIFFLRWLILKHGAGFFAFIKSITISIKQAIISNPDVQKLLKNHPLFFGFLKRRLDKKKFSGLPLTLLGIAFIYIFSLFLGIIEDIITSDIIVAADLRVANLLYVFRNSFFTKVFLWITLLGKWQMVATFIALCTILFWIWKKREYIFPFWITVSGGLLSNLLTKFAFNRQRPAVAFYTERTPSFPSGHATIAIALYGFIAYFLLKQVRGWKHKLNIFFAAATLILAIGFSRLYLGVHFVSDVWGGYLLGLVWLIIGIGITEWTLSSQAKRPALADFSRLRIVSIYLIVAQVTFYTSFALHYQPPYIIKEPKPAVFMVSNNLLNIFDDYKLSKYTETLIGTAQEPLSFVITAKDDQEIITRFQKAGWYLADRVTVNTLAKLVKAAVDNEEYLTAPMTPDFWNGQVHNFGFEKPTNFNSVRQRHHARFWKTDVKTLDGKNIYVGTASLDIGLKWFITHKISPDIDREREVLFEDLHNTGDVLNSQKEKLVGPSLGKNFTGDQFFTDGKIYLINLK